VVGTLESRLRYYTPLELLLLAVLYVDNAKPINGKVFLQKIIFVLDRNIEEIKARFDGYYIGPYSEDLEIALEQFTSSGYIIIGKHNKIFLSEKGLNLAQEVISRISKERLDIISDIKKFFNDLTQHELIAIIYSTFPEYAEKSDIKKEYASYKMDAAISLYKKGKISLSKAAEIAGMKIEDFITLIKKEANLW